MNEFKIQEISENKFVVRESGIEFLVSLSFAEWEGLGQKLSRLGRSIGFLIGDWINYGEKSYGKTYLNAIQHTGFDYSTLRDFASVARRVQLSCRHDNLGFEHHKLVANLEPKDQRKWLETAATHGLSKRRLRKSIRLGHVVGLEEMQCDPTDRGQATYMHWINQLCYWWRQRIDKEPLEKWSKQARMKLKRDLEPIIRIYESL